MITFLKQLFCKHSWIDVVPTRPYKMWEMPEKICYLCGKTVRGDSCWSWTDTEDKKERRNREAREALIDRHFPRRAK